MTTIDAASILGYFCRLADAPERPATEMVLQELTLLFDAAALGLRGSSDGFDLVFPADSVRLPWRADGELAKKIQASLTAEIHMDDAGSWLVNAVGRPGDGGTMLVWLFRPAPLAWSEAERWHWLCASQALVRWLDLPESQTAAVRKRLELAAVVTGRLVHDFGNYLTGILGFTELSLTQTPVDARQRVFLQEVLQSAQQGAAWIHRLQLFCRRSGGPFWPTALASVLAAEEACVRLSDMRWHAEVPKDLPLLAIDAVALQVALHEVVNNAREATKNQGTIRVSARTTELTDADCRGLLGAAEPGAHVEVSLADDGPGITAADQTKLFQEMFYSTKPRQRGVGLLVVYGILQRHRAGFRLEAGEAGRGLCVRFYVPTALLESPALTAGEGPPHVLVVHANPLLFDSVRTMLETHGCQVSEANSAQAALASCLMPSAPLALIVIDLALPNMAGLELARQICAQQGWPNFLFLHTQPPFHAAPEELLKRFPLLSWPLQPAAFLTAVRKALRRVR